MSIVHFPTLGLSAYTKLLLGVYHFSGNLSDKGCINSEAKWGYVQGGKVGVRTMASQVWKVLAICQRKFINSNYNTIRELTNGN